LLQWRTTDRNYTGFALAVNAVTRRYRSDIFMEELRTVIAAENAAAARAKQHQIT
jgi:hypothetical protein